MPPSGVGRSPTRQRGRFGSSPIPARPHPLKLPRAGIPRPFGAERFGRGFAPSFFIGSRLESASGVQGCFPLVQLPSVCQSCPPADCPPIEVLFYRLRAPICVVGLRPPMPIPPAQLRGGLSAPLASPRVFFIGLWAAAHHKKT